MNTLSALSARSIQYYVIAKQWLSDLDFFQTEIAFFHHILDNHFTTLADAAFIRDADRAVSHLTKLEIDMAAAGVSLTDQVQHVELMAEDIIPECADEVAVKQIELEYLMAAIGREYRDVKKQIFAMIGGIMHNNKLIAGGA